MTWMQRLVRSRRYWITQALIAAGVAVSCAVVLIVDAAMTVPAGFLGALATVSLVTSSLAAWKLTRERRSPSAATERMPDPRNKKTPG